MRRPARARHRQKTRGSAFIEALAVMLLCTLMFGCVLLFGRTYSAQIFTAQAARADAWQHTQPGGACSDQRMARAAQALSQAVDGKHAQALLHAWKGGQDSASTSAASVGRWQGAMPWLAGSPRASAETRTLFTCNESARKTDASASLRALAPRMMP